MTVCIGALCENRRAVVLVSDRMWTERGILYYEFEPDESKIERIHPHAAVATSGGVVLPDRIIKLARSYISEKFDSIESIEDIANVLAFYYGEERKRRIEEEYFRPRGLTIKEFYEKSKISTLPPGLAQFLDQRVADYQFELVMLLGGVDSSGGHLFLISDPGTYDSVDKVGFAAIGTGGRHAELTLIQNDFRPTVNLSEAVFLTYLAKKSAEHAPGVGQKTDMVIITQNDFFEIKDGDQIFAYLDGLYDKLEEGIKMRKAEIMRELRDINEFLKR